MEKVYPEGLFFNYPSEKAPDFVIGKISIKSNEFVEWLNGQALNEKGYVYFDVLKSKDGRPYCVVNDFKPTKKYVENPPESVDGDTPF